MNLYIIGNGFDRAHDLPCKYSDFCSFLKQSDNKDFNDLVGNLEDIFSKEDLWSDFEKALGKPNINAIKYINRSFNLNVFSTPFVNKINSALISWIININNFGITKKYNLSKDDLYFSFNYTSTLEIQYDIDFSKVKHIHGFIGEVLFDFKHSLVVGHGEELTNNSIELLRLTKKNTKKIISENEEYFENLKKANIEHIKVIGFSYSDIDIDYFAKIKQVLPNAKWILGWFSESDKDKANKYNNDLNLNAEIIKTNNLLKEII